MATSPGLPKQSTARVAVFHIDAAAEAVLADCFKQFNISVIRLDGDIGQRLWKEKFEACVVPLDHAEAAQILDAARNSPSNKRLVIYAIARDSGEALRFSKYGLNVVLPRGLERQTVLRAVRSSHLLVLHELRRYVRVPVVMEVQCDPERGQRFTALSQEVSGGGMSLSTVSGRPSPGESTTVTFSLPDRGKSTVRSIVCWARQSESREGDVLFGVRFNAEDDRRLAVRDWIEAYLDM